MIWGYPYFWKHPYSFLSFRVISTSMIMGERVVLTLISNAFFLACFFTPHKVFWETRFANVKPYSMLIFHHFVSPRTKNPQKKVTKKLGPENVESSPKKHPWHLGNLPISPRTFRCDYLLKASSDQIFFQRKSWSISCWKWLDLLVQRRWFGILGAKMDEKKDERNIGGWLKWMCFFWGGWGEREREKRQGIRSAMKWWALNRRELAASFRVLFALNFRMGNAIMSDCAFRPNQHLKKKHIKG